MSVTAAIEANEQAIGEDAGRAKVIFRTEGKLDGLEVAAEGDLDLQGFFGLDSSVRAGFTGIRLDVTPIGPESPERYRELADAVDAHCPVLDLFTNATPVERRLAVPA